MAHVHGKAGATPYDVADRFMQQALVLIIVVGTTTFLLFRHAADLGSVGVWGAAMLAVAAVSLSALVKGIAVLEGIARRYYGGAGGENSVGRLLARLPEEYHVFNGVQFYAGDIDHVVVGPTGVFVIETKMYSGTIGSRAGKLTRNGQPLQRDLLHQATAEAACLRDLLGTSGPGHVDAILVFVKAKVRIHETFGGVRVVPAPLLLSSIVRRSSSLELPQIRAYVRMLAHAMRTRRRVSGPWVTRHRKEQLCRGGASGAE